MITQERLFFFFFFMETQKARRFLFCFSSTCEAARFEISPNQSVVVCAGSSSIKHVVGVPLRSEDQKRRERGEHRRRAGQPHARADPGGGHQLVGATDRTAPGHPGRSAAVPQARQQGVGRSQLQQGWTPGSRID